MIGKVRRMGYILIMFGAILLVVFYLGRANRKSRGKDTRYSNEDEEVMDREVKRLIRGRRKSAAIKKYRKDHGGSLLQAKRHVDDIDDD